SIQSGTSWTHLYVTPREQDYLSFVLGGTVFYATLIFSYYFFKFPERLSRNTMVKVSPRGPRVMLLMLPLCILLTWGYLSTPNVQFVGQWLSTLGRAGSVFSVVFCILAWAQRPFNTWLVVLTIGCLLMASLAANTDFGRRDFLGVLMTLPICWYWLRGRYY